jgi:antitoxin component YwqK of YwqJK toxin-antitoxin module
MIKTLSFPCISIGIILLILSACTNSESHKGDAAHNFTSYTLEKIEGTDLTLASKFHEKLLMEELTLKDGKPHGNWTIYFDQNNRIKDHMSYYDGKLNGYWLKFNNLGRVEQMEQYRNGVLHGELIKYYSGVPIEYENYKNGLPHGVFKKYYPNQHMQQYAEFANGKLHGFWRSYNDEGKLTVEYVYKDGLKERGGIVE